VVQASVEAARVQRDAIGVYGEAAGKERSLKWYHGREVQGESRRRRRF
jgi:hypothetical protein